MPTSMIFQVEISEALSRIIEVEAQTENDAIKQIAGKFRDGDIVLDDSDFVDVGIKVIA